MNLFCKKHFGISPLVASIALVTGGVTFFASSQIYAEAPPAGSNISNIATASYVDGNGASKTTTSNEVKTTVLQVSSFTLEADRQQTVNPNGQVQLSHTLSNTGNGSDTYTLTLAQLTTDDFDLNNVRIYLDSNNDGVPDNNTNLVGQTVSLAAGESTGLIVVSTAPITATDGQRAQYVLTATSGFDSTDTDSDTDTVTIVSGPVLQVQKSANVVQAADGQEIEYTITYKNTGNAAADNVVIEDILDLNKVTYVAGSGVWSGASAALTDAGDNTSADTSGDPTGVKYNYTSTSGKVQAVLASVTPNTTGTIKFRVTANASNSENIVNVATVYDDNNDDPNDAPPTSNPPVSSNDTIVERAKTNTGTINDNSANTYADAGTVTTDPALDNQIISTTTQGTPIVFGDNTGSADAGADLIAIHNTGNTTETYNVTINKSDLPAGSVVQLFKDDGVTPLTDTNGDGIVDTGPIEPGATVNIVTKVTLPSGYSDSDGSTTTNDVILMTDPVGNDDPAANDTLKLVIQDVLPASVDLFTDDGADTTSGTATSGASGQDIGSPVETKTVNPGDSAIFQLDIVNNGSNPDNFNLTSNTLPEGWTVQYFMDDGLGNPTGSAITNTGDIAPGSTVHLVAVVTPPADASPTTQDVIFTVTSPATGLSDSMTDQVVVEDVRKLLLTSDNVGQVAPGGTVTYTHTLTNNGNIIEGNDAGELPFTLADSGADWISNVYVDVNGNGIADANELVTNGDLSQILAPVGGLAPGESVHLIVKVEAPSDATPGMQDSTVLKVSPTLAQGAEDATSNDTVAPLENTDLTTVNDGQVRLVKKQALDATCDGTADSAYTMNTIQAKPGECVVYQITATNEGNVTVTDVVINDSTPAYTTHKVAGDKPLATNAMITAQPADGASGSVKAAQSPLAPNATATLEFLVKIDQ